MRQLLCVLLLGCGGTSAPPPQPPVSPAPPVPAETPPTQSAPAELPGLDVSVCTQRVKKFGPVVLLRTEQLALRRGTGVTRFDQAPASKSAPIEVCMPEGERDWIKAAACADGSPPSAVSRTGSVGAGGVCGSIIDLYSVVCPEKTYEVYMDMYMCPSDYAGPGQP